jgi:hypothetical protein
MAKVRGQAYSSFVAWRIVNGVHKGRVVFDRRALNKVTISEACPMPLRKDVIAKLGGKTCMIVIDARSYFY